MLPAEPLILLIDGNNLAHFLYTNLTPGQKMTPVDSLRLIEHTGSYAASYPGQFQVELCLDRSPGNFPRPGGSLRVFFAEYPQTADDLLLGRFWYHHFSRRPCLVITNDEAILEEVREGGGAALRVYDFVRRPGLVSPVFRAPQELPALSPIIAYPPSNGAVKDHALSLGTSIYFRIVREEASGSAKDSRAMDRETEKPATKKQTVMRLPPAPRAEPPQAVLHRLVAGEEQETEDSLMEAEPTSQAAEEAPQEEGPYYFLSIDTWPVVEGVRFLMRSFCPRHRAEYQELIGAIDLADRRSAADLRPADLRALAELLLHACGGEADFALRGSLMSRVRLALLQERGDPLSLNQLADRTGLKLAGLRGRIKEKAGRWIEILNP